MAPELFERRPYSVSADVWSFGCVAVLLGVPTPILQDHSLLSPYAVASDEKFAKLLELCRGAEEKAPPLNGFFALVRMCLQKAPEARATMEMALALPLFGPHVAEGAVERSTVSQSKITAGILGSLFKSSGRKAQHVSM
jgi:serine/threonine protein kinase